MGAGWGGGGGGGGGGAQDVRLLESLRRPSVLI